MVEVKQGDILKLNFDPAKGHEQSGFRPALVVSNSVFNSKTNMTLVCPITSTKRVFPLHKLLDNRTKTTGMILCEQIRSLDLSKRKYTVVEAVPKDILDDVIDILYASIY